MADINTVIPKIVDALNEACDVAGQPHPYDQIASLAQQVATLTAANNTLAAQVKTLQDAVAALGAKITAAKAALA